MTSLVRLHRTGTLECSAFSSNVFLMARSAAYLDEKGLRLILKEIKADLVCQKGVILHKSTSKYLVIQNILVKEKKCK